MRGGERTKKQEAYTVESDDKLKRKRRSKSEQQPWRINRNLRQQALVNNIQ